MRDMLDRYVAHTMRQVATITVASEPSPSRAGVVKIGQVEITMAAAYEGRCVGPLTGE